MSPCPKTTATIKRKRTSGKSQPHQKAERKKQPLTVTTNEHLKTFQLEDLFLLFQEQSKEPHFKNTKTKQNKKKPLILTVF